MTQRIFDVNNPQEIFDLFPDDVIRIEKSDRKDTQDIIIFNDDCWDYTHIKIDWRDKTEITRPVDETEWIGCLCWFWDGYPKEKSLGILEKIDRVCSCPYKKVSGCCYQNCRPVRRDEIKFVEDME